LSVVVKQVGKKAVALPEGLARLLLGNLGFSKLPTGALEHLKYPIVIDGTAFRARTGWSHSVNEVEVLRRHRLLLDAEG
jgi:UDP-glucose 4-epimerase